MHRLPDVMSPPRARPLLQVLVAYLSLDCLLALVLGVESLTDLVVETDPDKQRLQHSGRHEDVRREVRSARAAVPQQAARLAGQHAAASD